MAEGKGYGKCILFNEHFVVYGIPSIVSAISDATVAIAEKTDSGGIQLIDNRPATPGYKEEKKEHQEDSLRRILGAMDISMNANLRITLKGDLFAASGVGASAASCTAIARTLNQLFDMGLDDDRINEIAYEGEKGYHGTPSGVDNTASTYGGMIWFVKGEPNTFDLMKIPQPVEIVMGNTGTVANTKAAVAGVKERREKNPEEYDKIFSRARNIAYDARKALESSDLKEVGRLMNVNHQLLQKIEVSNGDLDALVETARKAGAFGAKMTGGGLGGYMVALTPGESLQEKVSKAIKKKGFSVLKTKIGV
ncbi:MAG: mevalonate kinase [Theionarchaea archaeon]|nr:mevalonate kinase [Theionarchaea archaeon]MBU7036650.1 mevalonate kinase [Theionarchaea archaeon]